MSVYYFYFSSIALHYSSCMTFLYLLLFLSYPDIQGRDYGTAIVPVSMNSFSRENIKTKTQSFQPETGGTSINCSFLQIKEPGHEAQICLCFLLYCHRCGRKKEKSETQGLAACLFSWNFSFSNKQRFKHQTPILWNLLPILFCICPLTEYNKGRKKVVCQQNFSGNTYTFLSS